MTYIKDLSFYPFGGAASHRPVTKTVGWLAPPHDYQKADSSDEILDKLWNFCRVSINQTRGIHGCEFCYGDSHYAKRNDIELGLGSAEIRVFGRDGSVYAAPTLIYHYMSVHKYKPPEEFLRALEDGPAPPSQEYFDKLTQLGIKWHQTHEPAGPPMMMAATHIMLLVDRIIALASSRGHSELATNLADALALSGPVSRRLCAIRRSLTENRATIEDLMGPRLSKGVNAAITFINRACPDACPIAVEDRVVFRPNRRAHGLDVSPPSSKQWVPGNEYVIAAVDRDCYVNVEGFPDPGDSLHWSNFELVGAPRDLS